MHDPIESGLSAEQAKISATNHGTNALTRKKKLSFARRYLTAFGDPIIRILLVALGINLLLLFRDANWYESAGIAVAVLLATLISTLSEMGSESAFEKLQAEAAQIKCRVRRGYKLLHLPIDEIVVGDIVLLQAGEKIPADGVIVAGEIAVDQSALNGEAYEARKYPFRQPASAGGGGFAPVEQLSSSIDLFHRQPASGERGRLASGPKGTQKFPSVPLVSGGRGKSTEDVKRSAGVDFPLPPDAGYRRNKSTEDNNLPTAAKTNADFLAPAAVFRGSVVCSGEGIMQVARVGDATFYGQLAGDIQEENTDSPLKARLRRLATLISRFGYGAAAVVFFANLFNAVLWENQFNSQYIMAYLGNTAQVAQDFMTALTLGITVIVMAVPEGLPMMITVVLSANMRRMLKDNVLVRKLVGIETSGSLNILFTDKTGTLTRGALSVSAFVTASGKTITAARLRQNEALYDRVALNCFYNSGAQIATKKLRPVAIGGNATDRALLEFIMPDAHKLPLCTKNLFKPFDSTDKFMATEVTGQIIHCIGEKNTVNRIVLVKGAPEALLPACRYAYDEHGRRIPINSNNNGSATALYRTLQIAAREGVRLLALCETASSTDIPVSSRSSSKGNLTLVGVLAIRDELRPEAAAAIREVRGAGVQVVMVTGDNRETAVNVATQLGLLPAPTGMAQNPGAVLTSSELNALTDEEVKARLPYLRVVARALPADKGRLVRLSQELGLVAGMTGDGVNDAPALKKADVGFSMGDGTEIAKEAGDIVITDNNIASIVRAILYGRTIFKSIRKFLIFQLTINLCAVGISVIGPFIGIDAPVTIIQMLWINMIMDTLAGLAFAGEPPLPEYMRERPKPRNVSIINRYMFSQILTTGVFVTLMGLVFLTLPAIREFYRNDPRYLQTAFFGLFVFAGVFNALNARTTRLNLTAYLTRNRAFIAVMSAVAVMQLILIYHGGTVFRTTGLSLRELGLVITLASTVILCDIARKIFLRMKGRQGYL